MRNPDPKLYLLHIRDACQQLAECLVMRDTGAAPDWLLNAAAVRYLEIIGEASRRFPVPFKMAHPEIPWQSMNATRNFLIHDYDNVDRETLWAIVARDVPVLHKAVLAILAELSEPS